MTDALPETADVLVEVVRTVIAEVRPRLIDAAFTGSRGATENLRHRGNFLSSHDLWLHRRYRDLLGRSLDGFVYASEEGDPEVVGSDPDPDLLVLVDPLDTSELAVRGLLGYTHVMAYSRGLKRPVAAVVGDLFHHIQMYVAGRGSDGRDRACAIVAGAEPRPMSVRPSPDLSHALVTNYLMRPADRFGPLARQDRLLTALGAPSADGTSWGRIGVDFGSVGLCHVAAGFTDAMVEFAKGFAAWDLFPGHYILHAAGGTVLDLAGDPLPLDYGLDSMPRIRQVMGRRQRFVGAGSRGLAGAILDRLET